MNFERLYMEYPYIESDQLILKKIEHEDLDDFYELCSDDDLFHFKPGKAKTNKKSVDNMIDHYLRDFNKRKMIFLGIYLKPENKLIGLGEIFDIDKKASVVTFGYTLNQKFWGNGYASTYTAMVLNYLFNTINVNRIQAFVMPGNEKSHNVLLRNNFTKEGTIRQGYIWKGKGVVDLTLYSILKEEYKEVMVR